MVLVTSVTGTIFLKKKLKRHKKEKNFTEEKEKPASGHMKTLDFFANLWTVREDKAAA